jgi:cell division septal protein FtsQ
MGLFKRKKQQGRSVVSASQNTPREQKVFSYYTSSHKNLNTLKRTNKLESASQAATRHGRTLKNHWFGLTATVILLASSVYIMSLSYTPHVVVNGTVYRSLGTYQSLAEKELKDTVLNLVKPTLQRNAIEKKLKQQIPEASQIIVNAPLLGRRPNIIITMDEPAAVMKQQGSQDLIISERGRLLLAANQSKSTTNLPVIVNQSGVTGKAGEQFLRPDDMRSLSTLFEQIKLSTSSASYILPPQTREILMVEPGRGVYQVRFLFGDTILQQFGALRATQKKLQEMSQTPSEYIDVRLANKIFYK